MDNNTDKLIELGKSAIVDFVSAVVLALFIVLGTYIAVNYLGMDQVAAVGLMAILATPVYNQLPAGTVNLVKAFVSFFTGYVPKKDDRGEVSPIFVVLTGALALIVAGAAVLVFYFNVDVWAVLSGIGLLVIGAITSRLVKPTAKWPGVSIATDTQYKVKMAYISWSEFDRSRIKVAGIPSSLDASLYQVRFTYKGKSWLDNQCRWDDVNGVLYSLSPDPVADEVYETDMEVWNAMEALKTGAEKLEYIVGKYGAKGGDVKYLKALLCLGREELDRMTEPKSGTAYRDFVDDVDADPWNLRSSWPVHLKHEDYFLVREADWVYYDFYKKA